MVHVYCPFWQGEQRFGVVGVLQHERGLGINGRRIGYRLGGLPTP